MTNLTMRIQRNNNLNEIYISDSPKDIQNGVSHVYDIAHGTNSVRPNHTQIVFQQGPRKDPNSTHGVIESDLLEIVRHRLQKHQASEYRTRESALALTAVEEALLWLAKRADDRAERGVLGTTEK